MRPAPLFARRRTISNTPWALITPKPVLRASWQGFKARHPQPMFLLNVVFRPPFSILLVEA
jgi:hypothetical protein